MTANRPHGRTKYVVEKCRCSVCRKDSSDYERNRARQRAYGRPAYVDAEPARRHIAQLQAAGMGWKRVAEQAGLSSSVVWKLLYGDPARNMAPSKRIRARTEARILAVSTTLSTLGATVTVDGTGTRRRLQALIARGWSQSRLAERLGMLATNFGRTLRSERVRAETARQVQALYEALWNINPPEHTQRDRIAASRARRYATEHGWVPPMAWDDDAIDDPDATPDTGGQPVTSKRVTLPPVDELLYLLNAGESRALLAARFHVSENAIERALLRGRSVGGAA